MNAHGASVYRLALNQTRSPHDAEDVSQDVFLRLLRDKTDFVDDGHLKAWLLRVTINRCLEVRRSAWRRRAVIGADEEWATLEAVADGMSIALFSDGNSFSPALEIIESFILAVRAENTGQGA